MVAWRLLNVELDKTVTRTVSYFEPDLFLPGVMMLLLDDEGASFPELVDGKAPKSGKWTGSSEFGRFEFILNPDSTAITKIIYEFSNFTCGAVTTSGTISINSASGWPVSEDRFTIENVFGLELNRRMIIEGSFDDTGKQASGTWTAIYYGTTCKGSWKASFFE